MFINSVKEKLDTFEKEHIGLVGLLATMIGIISFLPVLYVVYKTKRTINFPYKTLILALISNILWIYYATAKSAEVDTQIAIMGSLYFFIYAFILFTKIFN